MATHWENIQRPYIRKNIQTPFPDTQEGKDLIINQLNERCKFPKKNLIYYTVFGREYREIFEYSLKSIKKFTKDVDIFAISDQADLDCNTIIQPPVEDFIESSMKKMDIFELLGQDIFSYDNVLFLDCDILAIKPLNFLQQTLDNKLYVVRSRKGNNIKQPLEFQLNLYHGLKIPLTEEQVKTITENDYAPFNAGQFMFKPTKEMKDHFNNVRWLSKNWPGEYFYEQGFMNYYFCVINALANFSILDKETDFFNLNTNTEPSYNEILIHYIGKQIAPEAKLEQMAKDYNTYISCQT